MAGKTLNIRYLPLTVSVASGITAAAPQVTQFPLGDVVLDEVSITIPLGHGALTGIALEYDGVRLVPWSTANDYVVGDDDRIPFAVDFDVSHPLTVKAFNTDIYAHKFYLLARVHDRMTSPSRAGGVVAPLVL